MIKSNYALLSLLLATQTTAGMLLQVRPTPDLLKKLNIFHETTFQGSKQKPTIEEFKKEGRVFVAKLSIFGFGRYFLVKDNKEIDTVVRGMDSGGGTQIDWLCCDPEENETIVMNPESKVLKSIVADLKPFKKDDGNYNVAFMVGAMAAKEGSEEKE